TITLVLPIARPPEPSAAETPGVAAVSIRDPRIRSMVSGVLGVVGFDIRQTDHGAPDEADLWVTDAASATPRSACQFVRARPSRRVVALGVEADAAAEWMAAGAITLPAGAGPGAIRSAALGGPPEAHETPVAAGRSAGIR